MSTSPAEAHAGPSDPRPHVHAHAHNFLAEPHHDPAAELALVRSISPRLRSSRDGDIERELEDELAREITNGASARNTPTPAAPAPAPLGPPPDGGLEAWLVVAGSFLSLFCIFGLVTGMGQLQAYYLAHQLVGTSKSTVAWIASVQTMMVFGGSVFFGRVFDIRGPRALTIGGVLVTSGALVAIAFCKVYYQFLLSHMLFGIGGTFIYSPATGIAGHWFLARRSTAVGIIVAGGGLGGIIYPILIKELSDRLKFRDAMLIVAGFNFVMMAPACVWMKSRLPPKTPPPWRDLAKPWRDMQYVCLVVGVAFVSLNIFTPYFNAPVYAAGNRTNATVHAYSIVIMQTGAFLGRVTGGLLADRFGVWNAWGAAGVSMSITAFAFWTGTPIGSAGVVIGLLLYGYTSGAYITLISASIASISPVSEIGARMGMNWSAIAIPMLIGPVLSGRLIQAQPHGTFTYAGIFVGCTALVGITVSLWPLIWRAITRVRRKGPDEERGKTDEGHGEAASQATLADEGNKEGEGDGRQSAEVKQIKVDV
ncbi:hypothetical protein VHUM_01036 [Vanrija humicola]|uniref:Major facilitator superfamily (MFS) profile domain-containing protein n=1 Tax=Vanrija humicola TaxID=5417 RepID=A0A7D8Z365_VANHU|nr:hypothetical protein VHUM_01036 [Vanrija humicola]